jgi:hypothetical protein
MGMGATDPLVVEFQCLSLADTATRLTKGTKSRPELHPKRRLAGAGPRRLCPN